MKYFSKLTVSLMTALMSTGALQAADGITINHLSPTNSLVRVHDSSHYLLLPVEESVDDATINILVDGRPVRNIMARLARNRVDYFVPFDLTTLPEGEIVLNVVAPHNRSSVRETSQDACWSEISLSDTFDTTNREEFRPAYHHTPLYGWMNDPNGMFYKDGVWHLYYQWNPYGSKWQNLSWGHSTSTDLINWEHQPVALEPDGLGLIFSGSSVVDSKGTAGFGENEIIALYTAADINQMQSLAHSSDNGHTFTKYPGNPIITLDSEARDPNMFFNEATGEWNLLLAHALDHEMLIFTSPDLKTWTLQSAFGKGIGAQDGVWECPDLLELPVEGTDQKKWMLICNINPGGPFGGSGAQYFTGDFDGKTFKVDTPDSGIVPTRWMDYGKDHYATVSWSGAPDSRKVVIGWMSNWQYAAEVPTKQFRSANTLPRDLSLFIADDGQYHLRTLPSPEVNALRGRKTLNVKSKDIKGSGSTYALPADGLCEIDATLIAGKAKTVTITLSNDKGEKAVMTFNPGESTFSFDRTQSGLTDFSHEFPAVTVAPTLRKSASQSLRIFVDRSSVEVFDSEGNFVMTNLVFPTSPYTKLTVSSEEGQATIKDLEIYSIKH